MIKFLQKAGIQVIYIIIYNILYINIIKAIYNKPTANSHNGEKLKEFPLKSGIRQGCQLSHYYST